MLKADIDRDLKTAMLAGDKRLVSILRSIKSAILYKEVEAGKRDQGLDDLEIVRVLKRERKTRRDSSEVYKKANETERAAEEDYQIEVIEKYLPEEMSEEQVKEVVEKAIDDLGLKDLEMKDMGRVIGTIKKDNESIDGAILAKVVKAIITKG